MRKIKLFVGNYFEDLTHRINSFGEEHEIIQLAPVSGSIMWVLYEDKED